MSLQSNISSLVTRIATEFKSVRTAIELKANINSPTFTGTPTSPTPTAGDNTTKIATTAFVNTKVSNDATPLSHVGSGGSAHAVVTTSVNGFMSATDKTKLDGIIGTNTGDQTTITGNAGSATVLQTARTINGVSFNGSANITINAVDSTARIASSEKGSVNGVATLDATGRIPSAQLPSYVDDVVDLTGGIIATQTGMTSGLLYYITGTNKICLATGATTGTLSDPESGKVYVDSTTNKTYRYSGSTLVIIGTDLALGETAQTAYRGDRGKTAYDHSQIADGTNPHATTYANIVNKPTTVAGAGLTDVFTKTEIGDITTNFVTAFEAALL